MRGLDAALDGMHVHREAYYGGTFTGNHAHKCLKVHTKWTVHVYMYMNMYITQRN